MYWYLSGRQPCENLIAQKFPCFPTSKHQHQETQINIDPLIF